MISCFSGTDLPAPDVECNERLWSFEGRVILKRNSEKR
jgi:hypothetical protein